jgi:molybdenum cofactor synthesis domain-containing protein
MDLIEAKQIALSLAKRLDREPVDLGSALGRVLAEPVWAGVDLPGNPRSKWDGFALSCRDCESAGPDAPVFLEIAPGETVAGKRPEGATGGKSFRIMTGSVLPAGTDAVIPYEDAVLRENFLVMRGPLRSGSGVIAPGSEARRDDLLLEEGDVLTPTRLALAAAAGRKALHAIRRPRVAVLATGDELVGSGRGDEYASTHCNNTHLFGNLVRSCGAEPIELGVAPDDPEVICRRLREAEADLMITTGGMGRGSRDFIPEVWKRLDLKTHFEKLNLVPGKGSALATGNGCIYLGLPGNPWAGRIVYEEIAAPVIRGLLGLKGHESFWLDARSLGRMTKKKGVYQAFEGVLQIKDMSCDFIPNSEVARARSGISSLRMGLAYALLGPESTELAKGETVQVKVPDLPLLTWAILNSRAAFS